MQLDESFIFLVLSIVDEIPYGKVSTYGDIAKLAGYPRYARHVGKVLASSQSLGDYPCHRVVNATGRTAPGWDEQVSLLEAEGITFLASGNVNLKKHKW